MFGIQQDGTYRVENIGYSVADLTTGYVVAIRPIQREADVPTTGTLFGRWTNTTPGEADHDDPVYWDEVEVIEDYTAAMEAAVSRGELAIWDVVNGMSLDTQDYLTGADER